MEGDVCGGMGLGTARKSAQERRLILFFQSATADARHTRAESSSQVVVFGVGLNGLNMKNLAIVLLIIQQQDESQNTKARPNQHEHQCQKMLQRHCRIWAHGIEEDKGKRVMRCCGG